MLPAAFRETARERIPDCCIRRNLFDSSSAQQIKPCGWFKFLYGEVKVYLYVKEGFWASPGSVSCRVPEVIYFEYFIAFQGKTNYRLLPRLTTVHYKTYFSDHQTVENMNNFIFAG